MTLEVVSKRTKSDSVVGRRRAADADEGLTFDIFQLHAENESAHGALVEVLPEADLGIHDLPVVGDACRRRAGGEAVKRRSKAAAVVKGGIAVAKRAEVARLILLNAGIAIECQILPRINLYACPGMERGERG